MMNVEPDLAVHGFEGSGPVTGVGGVPWYHVQTALPGAEPQPVTLVMEQAARLSPYSVHHCNRARQGHRGL